MQYLGRIVPDMDVCDINGDRIGTVKHVYRHEAALVGAGVGGPGGLPEHEEMIEVKTGLLGLGKHYWVPFSAVEEVTQACVFLKRPKDELDSAGWDERPSYLDEMS